MLKPHHNESSSRIVFLDYLRIFAFVSVLIGHKLYGYILAYSNNTDAHATPRLLAKLSLPFFYGGGAGVVIFFLVSGYIIAHVLQHEKPLEFLIKRCFRIYPLYISAVLLEYALLWNSGTAPKLSTLIVQLTLLGDFFHTPYALNNVEWTLRLEIIFYLIMALARSLKLTTDRVKLLPYYLLAATITCGRLAPIPSIDIWSKGYLTMYCPFMFLGSIFYLYEKSRISATFTVLFTGLVFCQYYQLISLYQTSWLNEHFAILALLIFLGCLFCRNYITAPSYILLLSDMTYSVYLFHYWLYDTAKKVWAHFDINFMNVEVQALLTLFLFCFLMMHLIEKQGIKVGRWVIGKY